MAAQAVLVLRSVGQVLMVPNVPNSPAPRAVFKYVGPQAMSATSSVGQVLMVPNVHAPNKESEALSHRINMIALHPLAQACHRDVPIT